MIRIFNFIEHTEEIFEGVKNIVGVKINSKYYLSDSQALSMYVKKCRQNPNHNFTATNISGFLNKCRYFIYPKNRTENYKVDISVRDFSERCVTMFFKRFGINFSFLRINSDNEEFVKMQQRCLENLFEQIISMFSRQKEFSENDFLHLLEMYYCRYRFDLHNADMDYMLSHYDVIMQSELSDYLVITTDAFHKLKFIYTRANYVVGRKEYIQEIRKHYREQINEIKLACRLIADTVKSGKNNVENFNIPDLSAVAAYMLYENNYGEVLKDFKKICSFMVDIRNKHSELYDRILNMELVKFECMINKFYFYILVQYQNSPENDA